MKLWEKVNNITGNASKARFLVEHLNAGAKRETWQAKQAVNTSGKEEGQAPFHSGWTTALLSARPC